MSHTSKFSLAGSISSLPGAIGAGLSSASQLQMSEQLFAAFMDNFSGFAWMKDTRGRYVYANRSLQELYSRDCLGHTDEAYWPDEIAAQYRRNDEAVIASRQPLQTVEPYLLNGEKRQLLVTKFPICDSDGAVVMVGGTGVDITAYLNTEAALQQAEQKYHDILESVQEGIFQTTPEGQCITGNPALAHMLGFDSVAELITTRQNIGREGYVEPERRETLKRLLEEHGLVRNFEFEAYKKDGSKIWLSDNVRAVRDDSGKLLFYEGTVADITERKRAEFRSATFSTLARELSGAVTQMDAARIIAATAANLFGWDSCNLDAYDRDLDLVYPMLNVDTIAGMKTNVTAVISNRAPTVRSRRVIEQGSELILREEPARFDKEAIPFGDQSRPSASIMSVPVRHASEVIGLLSIQSYASGAYDRRALDDFQALADYCGEALNRIGAEQSLLESEERYRDLVENSHEFICTHDLDGKILSANRAAGQLLGYDPKEFIGKRSIRDILAPEVRDQFDDYMTRILKEGTTTSIMRVVTSSGERRVWEYYNSLRTNGVATPIVRGIARDITESRRAEKALRESEERYRELFENSKDALYVHNMSGEYTSVNRAAEKLSGYSRHEIAGKHFGDFVVPEYAHEVRENWKKKLEHAGETSYEIEIITKQGRRIPVEVNSRLIYENDVPVAVQGSVRDITDRKQAQEASRTYARGVIEAQEAERRRISLELHDQIGQILTAVKINLHALQRSGNGAAVLTGIDDNLKVIDEAFVQVRNLSADLRPLLLDDFGLVVALRWYLERQTKKTGVPSEFVSLSLHDDDRFASELETACFRIAQEALTNVIRHAQARQISVSLESSGTELALLIKDDGIGFDVRAVRAGAAGAVMLGLRGMEERAQAIGGTVTVSSAPGKGTKVRAHFPQSTRVEPATPI